MKTTLCFFLLSSFCLAGFPPTQAELDEAVHLARQVRKETLERKERQYDVSITSIGRMKQVDEQSTRLIRMQREAMYKSQERARTLIPVYYYPVYIYYVPYRTRSITIRY